MTEKLDFFCKHSKKVITFLIVFSLGVLIGTGLFLYNNRTTVVKGSTNPVVVEVDGEKIYLKEYTERLFAAQGGLGTPTNPEISESTQGIKESVLYDLGYLRIIEKELKKRNLSVTDAEVLAVAKEVFKDYDTRDMDVQNAYKRYVLLRVEREKLISAVVSWKEGYVLLCHFNRADMLDVKDKASAATVKA